MPSPAERRHATPVLAVVVPCFNEAAVILETYRRLTAVLDELVRRSLAAAGSFLCFVDDGSEDGTWGRIVELKEKDRSLSAIRLSRNYGHQYALLAGLSRVRERVDCAVTLDADLQDDIRVIETFLERYRDRYEIVYGTRRTRKPDTVFVRSSAALFYRFMRCLGADVVEQHADFRLTGRKVMDALEDHRESTVFLRDLLPSMGFKSAFIPYDRQPRLAGRTKYTVRKMVSFALDGITSSSTTPLRLIVVAGLLALLFSLIVSSFTVFQWLNGEPVDGWTMVMLMVCYLGAVQLISLGLIAEYLGRIFWEAKKRPRYIIEEEL